MTHMLTREDFPARYPEYADTRRLDQLRATEYPQLDRDGQVYLDYAGAGVPALAQLRAHADRLAGTAHGNPHSVNPSSLASTAQVEATRRAVLTHLNADPAEYAVIFTANATGACRLVGEAYPFRRGQQLVLTADNHNSVNGLRRFAAMGHATTAYVPFGQDLRIDERDLENRLAAGTAPRGRGAHRGLFAYPAQSNFSGVQHPLEWVTTAHRHGYDVLLDAAAYLPTSRLDLAVVKPDFVPISWYKLFGYPTGLGCLVARWEALRRLRRPWFAGGTVTAASVQGGWHALTRDESAFEDGTLNFLSIPDIQVGIDWLSRIDMDVIKTRVRCLTGWLLDRLGRLRHHNGRPVVALYGPTDTRARGGTIAFNLVDPDGHLIDERLVAKQATACGISIRTGCFCNPGVGEAALGAIPRAIRAVTRKNLRDVDDYVRLIGLPTGGAVRVSLGFPTNLADVERFLRFVEETYPDARFDQAGLPARTHC